MQQAFGDRMEISSNVDAKTAYAALIKLHFLLPKVGR